MVAQATAPAPAAKVDADAAAPARAAPPAPARVAEAEKLREAQGAERRAGLLSKPTPAAEARQRANTVADAAPAPAQAPPSTGPAPAAAPPVGPGNALPPPATAPPPPSAAALAPIAPITPAPRAAAPESTTSSRDSAQAAGAARPGAAMAPPESVPGAAARRDADLSSQRSSGGSVGGAVRRDTEPSGPQSPAGSVAAAPSLLPSLLNGPSLEPAQQRLLQRLEQVARGRWQRLPAGTDEPAATPLRAWQLPNDAAPRVRLRLDADGLRWTEAEGSRWFVPLEPAAVRALQALR